MSSVIALRTTFSALLFIFLFLSGGTFLSSLRLLLRDPIIYVHLLNRFHPQAWARHGPSWAVILTLLDAILIEPVFFKTLVSSLSLPPNSIRLVATHHLVSWPVFQALFVSAFDLRLDALRLLFVNVLLAWRRLPVATGGDLSPPNVIGLLLLQLVIGFFLPLFLTKGVWRASPSARRKIGYKSGQEPGAVTGESARDILATANSGKERGTALLNLDPLRPVPIAGAHLKSWGIDIADFTPEEIEEMEANLRKQLEAKGIENPLIRLELYSGCVYMVARVHAPGGDPEGQPIELDMLSAVPQRIRDRLLASQVVQPPSWALKLSLYARPVEDPEGSPAHLTLQVLAKGLGAHDPCMLTPCVWSCQMKSALSLHAAEWEVLGPDDSICTVVIDRVAMPDVLTIRLGEFTPGPEHKLVAISDATVAVPLIPIMLAGPVAPPDLQAPLAHVMEYAFRQPTFHLPEETSDQASTGAGYSGNPGSGTARRVQEGAAWSDLAWALTEEVETRGFASLGSFLKDEVIPLLTRSLPGSLLGRRISDGFLFRRSSATKRNMVSFLTGSREGPSAPPSNLNTSNNRNANSAFFASGQGGSNRVLSSLGGDMTLGGGVSGSRRSRPLMMNLPFSTTEQRPWTLTFRDRDLETTFLRDCLMPRVELSDLVSIFSSIPLTYLVSSGCAGIDLRWRFALKALSRAPWLLSIVLGLSRRAPRAYLLVPLVAQLYDAIFESAPSPFLASCMLQSSGGAGNAAAYVMAGRKVGAGFVGGVFLLIFCSRTVAFALHLHLATLMLPTLLGLAWGAPITAVGLHGLGTLLAWALSTSVLYHREASLRRTFVNELLGFGDADGGKNS